MSIWAMDCSRPCQLSVEELYSLSFSWDNQLLGGVPSLHPLIGEKMALFLNEMLNFDQLSILPVINLVAQM